MTSRSMCGSGKGAENELGVRARSSVAQQFSLCSIASPSGLELHWSLISPLTSNFDIEFGDGLGPHIGEAGTQQISFCSMSTPRGSESERTLKGLTPVGSSEAQEFFLLCMSPLLASESIRISVGLTLSSSRTRARGGLRARDGALRGLPVP